MLAVMNQTDFTEGNFDSLLTGIPFDAYIPEHNLVFQVNI